MFFFLKCGAFLMEYYSAKKKKKKEREEEILPFVTTWFDLEGIMLSKMSDKDKYHMISLTYGI